MTDTDLCNIALSNIGKGTITSMEGEVENARSCKLYYDLVRRQTLRAFSWGFAHRIERLALVDVDIAGWDYVYAYPDKCLMVNRIIDEDDRTDQETIVTFDIINLGGSTKGIVANVQNASVDYVWDVTDPDVMDSLFVEAFTYLLAANIANRLTGNPKMYDMQYQLYQAALQSARLKTSQEKRKKLEYHSSYADARFGRMVENYE